MSTKLLLDKKRHIIIKILPIYWAFLTYILLRKNSGIALDYWFIFPGIDKVVHFATFTVLGFLLKLSFPKMKTLFFVYIILIYAFLTEILQDQMKLGRSLETWDIIADFAGAMLGFVLCRILVVRRLN
ncbi:MAG: VanZ family protein [Cruoricaptor ignavus]|nr:VanZ family protein [Cruoricaptor ignavus]